MAQLKPTNQKLEFVNWLETEILPRQIDKNGRRRGILRKNDVDQIGLVNSAAYFSIFVI